MGCESISILVNTVTPVSGVQAVPQHFYSLRRPAPTDGIGGLRLLQVPSVCGYKHVHSVVRLVKRKEAEEERYRVISNRGKGKTGVKDRDGEQQRQI